MSEEKIPEIINEIYKNQDKIKKMLGIEKLEQDKTTHFIQEDYLNRFAEIRGQITDLKKKAENNINWLENHNHILNLIQEEGKTLNLPDRIEKLEFSRKEHNISIDRICKEIAGLKEQMENHLEDHLCDQYKYDNSLNELKEQFNEREEHQFMDYFKMKNIEEVLREEFCKFLRMMAIREENTLGDFHTELVLMEKRIQDKLSGGESKGHGHDVDKFYPEDSKPPNIEYIILDEGYDEKTGDFVRLLEVREKKLSGGEKSVETGNEQEFIVRTSSTDSKPHYGHDVEEFYPEDEKPPCRVFYMGKDFITFYLDGNVPEIIKIGDIVYGKISEFLDDLDDAEKNYVFTSFAVKFLKEKWQKEREKL